ncbi:hypothetical protein GCM10009647_078820 [Streptomyces sanglieri]
MRYGCACRLWGCGGAGQSTLPGPVIRRPVHAELFEVCPVLLGEFRGAFADVVEPGAELDHHGPVSSVLTAR